MTRAELLAEAWPDTYVNDDSLSRAVSQLRKALGDRAGQPRYIETIPSVGYRLIPEATWNEFVPEDLSRTDESESTRRSTIFIAAGAIVLAGVLILLAWRLVSTKAQEPERQPVPSRVTALPGVEAMPAVSPDGRYVLFSYSSGSAPSDVYIARTDVSEWRPLVSGPDNDTTPAWSPDGTEIAWVRESANGTCSVMVGSFINPQIQRTVAGCVPSLARDLAWHSPTELVVVDAVRDNALALFEIDLESDRRTQLTDPPEHFIGDARLAVHGARMAVHRVHPGGSSELVVRTGGDERRIGKAGWRIAGLDWSPDGKSLLVSGSPPGAEYGLWKVPLDGTLPRLLLGDGSIRAVSVAPSGFAILGRDTSNQDVYKVRRTEAFEAVLEPLISSTTNDYAPRLHTDGRRVALVSEQSGHPEVWIYDLETQTWDAITELGAELVDRVEWSGDSLLFSARVDANTDIYSVSLADRRVARLSRHHAMDRDPVRLANGDIVFASDRGGEWNLWLLSPAGELRRLTDSGGYHPVLDASGDWLYFQKWQRPGIWRLPSSDVTAAPREVLKETVVRMNWLPLRDGTIVRYRQGSLLFYRADANPRTGAAESEVDLPGDARFVVGITELSAEELAISVVPTQEHDLYKLSLGAD